MSEDGKETEVEAEASADPKVSFIERFKAFVNEYGTIAVVTWFSIFFATWAAFAALLSAGLDLGGWLSEGDGSGWLWNLVKDWGPVGLAYIPTQIVKPIRAAATFAITPVVHKLMYGKLAVDEPRPEDDPED